MSRYLEEAEYPGDDNDDFCTGPYCTPIYDVRGKQTSVDCRDCTLCNSSLKDEDSFYEELLGHA
jgi:hypothetical protein